MAKVKSLRDRGRKFEFWVRKAISKIFNLPLDGVLIRSKSAAGADVWVASTFKEKFPFAVECKNRNKLSFWKAVIQAQENAEKEGLFPLLIARRKREVWAALPLEVFFAIFLQVGSLNEDLIQEVKEKLPKHEEATLKG